MSLLVSASMSIACSDSTLADCDLDVTRGCVKEPNCGGGPNQTLQESTQIAIDETESFANFSQDGSFVAHSSLTGNVYLRGGSCPGATCPVEFASVDLGGSWEPTEGTASLNFVLYSLSQPDTSVESNGTISIAPGKLEMALKSIDDESCISTYQNNLPAGFVLESSAPSFAGGFTLANNRQGLVDVDLRGAVVAP